MFREYQNQHESTWINETIKHSLQTLTDWWEFDEFSLHIFGSLIYQHPKMSKVKWSKWSRSFISSFASIRLQAVLSTSWSKSPQDVWIFGVLLKCDCMILNMILNACCQGNRCLVVFWTGKHVHSTAAASCHSPRCARVQYIWCSHKAVCPKTPNISKYIDLLDFVGGFSVK